MTTGSFSRTSPRETLAAAAAEAEEAAEESPGRTRRLRKTRGWNRLPGSTYTGVHKNRMSAAGFDFDSYPFTHLRFSCEAHLCRKQIKKFEKADTMQLNQSSFVQSLNSWFRNATSGEDGRREGKCK